jgi:predicted 3-demethylubiquinone-9 3-methyltransferase (glyoxalase superfamily)
MSKVTPFLMFQGNAEEAMMSVLMPLDDYSFSKKFGWVVDKFGVSWQLTLPKE